jgi:hypothetical protein
MSWWLDIVIVAILAVGVIGFLSLVGVQTRWMSRRTTRRAEDLYPQFSDEGRRHRPTGGRRPPRT